MTDDWTDELAGARMQVDQRYQDTVDASDFSNQEWGLVMTAVEWDIENPENPAEAQLVADTSKLPDVVPELENIQEQMGGSPTPVDEGTDRSGFLGRLQQYFDSLTSNTGGQSAEKRLNDAEELVDGYAMELQEFLKERGRWEDLCAAAAKEQA